MFTAQLQLQMFTRRYLSYNAAFKLKVVEFAEKNGNRSAQRQFDVNEKQVRDWRKKRDELRSLLPSRQLQRVEVRPYWPELEHKLHGWILEKCRNGIGLSGTIRLKAKAMAREKPDIGRIPPRGYTDSRIGRSSP